MYYVIKRQKDSDTSLFIGFAVPKYITSQKSDNIILEFIIKNKPVRKWIKKDEVILLTDNKAYFLKTMDQFKEVEETQQKLVNEAKKNLNLTMEIFTETINAELDKFEEIKNLSDIPSLL